MACRRHRGNCCRIQIPSLLEVVNALGLTYRTTGAGANRMFVSDTSVTSRAAVSCTLPFGNMSMIACSIPAAQTNFSIRVGRYSNGRVRTINN